MTRNLLLGCVVLVTAFATAGCGSSGDSRGCGALFASEGDDSYKAQDVRRVEGGWQLDDVSTVDGDSVSVALSVFVPDRNVNSVVFSSELCDTHDTSNGGN